VPEREPDLILQWIGRRVAELRKAQRLTQAQLAERLDVSDGYLKRIERGRENLTVRSLVLIATALGTTIEELFQEPEHKSRPRPGRPPRSRR
jgi:transcriptional regulator with XRE-family HTH domain